MNTVISFLLENKQVIKTPKVTGRPVVSPTTFQNRGNSVENSNLKTYREKMGMSLPHPRTQSLTYTHTPANDAVKLFQKMKNRL